jgi:hypothetical protein
LEGKTEKNHRLQFAIWILKVLYTPLKTFEEIVKKPNIKGPILILLLTLPLTVGIQYISGVNFFLETPLPKSDLWTEKPSASSSFSWIPENKTTYDSVDKISGNYSVSNSVIDSSLIQMELTGIGAINASTEEYNRFSFSIKWINAEGLMPTTATIQLLSLNDKNNWFEQDIGSLLANTTDSWANITSFKALNLITSPQWTPHGSPRWDSITGIVFQLTWESPANLSAKVDDLFFGKYEDLTSSGSTTILLFSLVRSGVDFVSEWLILSVIAFLALKSFAAWSGSWKKLWLVVGYVYSTSIVHLGVLLLVSIFLPPIYLPYNATYSEYVNITQGSWGTPISVLGLVNYVWATILCTISLQKIGELGWSKAFLLGFGAIVMTLLLSSFLLTFLGF